MNEKSKINGNIQGTLRLIDEAQEQLEELWNQSEVVLTKGEVDSYKEWAGLINERIEKFINKVLEFEKFVH